MISLPLTLSEATFLSDCLCLRKAALTHDCDLAASPEEMQTFHDALQTGTELYLRLLTARAQEQKRIKAGNP